MLNGTGQGAERESEGGATVYSTCPARSEIIKVNISTWISDSVGKKGLFSNLDNHDLRYDRARQKVGAQDLLFCFQWRTRSHQSLPIDQTRPSWLLVLDISCAVRSKAKESPQKYLWGLWQEKILMEISPAATGAEHRWAQRAVGSQHRPTSQLHPESQRLSPTRNMVSGLSLFRGGSAGVWVGVT